MTLKNTFLFLFSALLGLPMQGQSILWSKKSNSISTLATYGVTFSTNGEKVLSGSECHPANIRMFDVLTGNLDWNYNVGTDFMCIQGVKFSSNGTLIASVEELGNILIFDNSGTLPTISDTIKTGTSYAFAADFSPANDRVVVGASSGKMNIYELPGGALVASLSAHPSYVMAVAYAPDGTMIASGGSDNKAKIWEADGTLKFTLSGHTNDVTTVKFTPDNTRLLTGGLDGKVKIWNVADGALLQTINAHTGHVKQLDISPDGSMIVTASSDQTSKIWDAQTGELRATFGNAGGGIVWSAAWSPDGTKIVTGTGNGDVILWDVSMVSGTDDLETLFKGAVLAPNPATDWVNLVLPSGLELATLDMYNALGEHLSSLEPAQGPISVSSLNSGVHYLKMVATSGHTVTLRLVINHH